MLIPKKLSDRIDRFDMNDEGHGYDAFGMSRDGLAFALGLLGGLYNVWFRVSSTGHEHIPPSGAAIVAANHSGSLPFDALMLASDVARQSEPPRPLRVVADYFVPNLPFISTLFARGGSVGGSRANLERLLERGELVAVFPEGTPGIGKHFRERYRLKPWRVGHAELALQHRAPIVPVGIVGAEEQMPQIARIPLGAKLFGAPYLPVTVPPFPLPVHYHMHYGPPILLHERFDPSRHSDPAVLEQAARLVADEVQRLVDFGLAQRKGIFR